MVGDDEAATVSSVEASRHAENCIADSRDRNYGTETRMLLFAEANAWASLAVAAAIRGQAR